MRQFEQRLYDDFGLLFVVVQEDTSGKRDEEGVERRVRSQGGLRVSFCNNMDAFYRRTFAIRNR